MAITKNEIIQALETMTLVELNELVKSIEEHFGVVAAAAVAMPSQETKSDTPSEVDLLITSVGAQKVAVIKAVKEITGLGLMDAKKLVDGATPITIKEKIKPEDGEKFKEILVAAGATVDLK